MTSPLPLPLPPRIVIDTNVLLDFWVFDDRAARRLRAAFEDGTCIALRSAQTEAELADVLARSEFALSAVRQSELIAVWRERSVLVEGTFAAPLHCTDPHDQKFLDLASTARADALVTKDKALLRLARKARPSGLRILAPAETSDLLPHAKP